MSYQRKSFVMYNNWRKYFEKLTPEQCKELICAIFAHAEGEEAEIEDVRAEAYFDIITDVMDINAEKYDKVKEKRREAINKRWASKNKSDDKNCADQGAQESSLKESEDIQTDTKNTNVYKCIQMNTNDTNVYKPIQTYTNDTVNVNDNVNGNDSGNVNDSGNGNVNGNVNDSGIDNDSGIYNTYGIVDNKRDIECKRVKEMLSPKGDNIKKSRKRFSPPTVAEVADYCWERHNNVDPDRFVDFYAAKGWMVGSSPMKDWKAAVRTWEQRGDPKRQPRAKPNDGFEEFMNNTFGENYGGTK